MTPRFRSTNQTYKALSLPKKFRHSVRKIATFKPGTPQALTFNGSRDFLS